MPSIGREDSLAELEISFNRQVRSGEITADVIEEESRAPSLGLAREDSLAQLKSSFHKQVRMYTDGAGVAAVVSSDALGCLGALSLMVSGDVKVSS